MKYKFIGISVIALISALLLSSCSKNEYIPLEAGTKSCRIEIEYVNAFGESILNDKSFINKIKIEGDNSHTVIKFDIKNNRLCFDADLPDQNDMKWSKDKREASGISRMTVRLGRLKVSLRCFIRYIANRPLAVTGGSVILEEVEYNGQTYKRSGGAVKIRVQINSEPKV